MIFTLTLLSCAGGDKAPNDDSRADSDPVDSRADDSAPVDSRADDSAPEDTGVPDLPWTDDPCALVDVGDDPFAAQIAVWSAQDDAAPPPKGGLVLVGSSTIRRWRTAQRALGPYAPLQRGVGGARSADVARHLPELAIRHAPSAVLMFAGTNDLADGRSVQSVVDNVRCVVQQLHEAQPGAKLFFAGITPTPSRWSIWADQDAVNQAIQSLAAQHPSIVYIDTVSALLATGSPPDEAYFVDGLHLNAAGYALWDAAVISTVRPNMPDVVAAAPVGPPSGSYLRVDLGPSNSEDGAQTPSVDGFGIRWNTWHGLQGGAQALAGEALRGLVTTTGAVTGVDLVLSGGFRANGLRNGGLTSPSGDKLGTLAVWQATADFFYTGDPDDPGGLMLSGLSPDARHTLRLFASRATDEETRITRFTVEGGEEAVSAEVTTTGPDIGEGGYDGNEGALVVFTGLVPDAYGRLHLDVDRAAGAFAYLNLLELEVE
ncbi:GDSL-type esterase/lipase family protein [Myxococcota bacterium]|nr:GDSL-type esterase/lipase family protein [Myxococcota bacterium]